VSGVAYGLEFHGAVLGSESVPAGLLAPDAPGLPRVEILHEREPVGERERAGELEPIIDHQRARFRLADGVRVLSMSRAGARAVFHGPPLAPDQLVHPYLGRVASVYSRWVGREAFHGGALIGEGGAWPVLGASQGGKSTLLAAFVARGGEVLADDLVVVEGNRVFAGPRCVDLRGPAAEGLPGGLPLTAVREGTRWRVSLGAVARCLPLAGWVFLSWGKRLELRRIGPADCLGRLAAWRARRQLFSDPAQMLALAGVPAFVLSRPRSWAALPATLDCLVNVLRGHPAAGPAPVLETPPARLRMR
jgi:hypothetical protein